VTRDRLADAFVDVVQVDAIVADALPGVKRRMDRVDPKADNAHGARRSFMHGDHPDVFHITFPFWLAGCGLYPLARQSSVNAHMAQPEITRRKGDLYAVGMLSACLRVILPLRTTDSFDAGTLTSADSR